MGVPAMRSTMAVIGGLLLLSGCAFKRIEVNGINVRESQYNEQSVIVRQRGSFDLSCPEDQLTVTLIAATIYHEPSQFGVSGCGAQATYVDIDDLGGSWNWARN